ncbi:hypothetical protein B0I35DRAFT_477037 [Stachybotrys elegans]|uniref:Rhodopsin domain-containing protein n=1 Tax=Stachybotrys elegans TaxID=80388 RepID=A0A8K0SWD8_9HYPO|nr:hypothetical protein B0I35DRAFT_477037 [Stachybotrys elegans]
MLLKWIYIGSLLYGPAALLTKLALLLIIARVFAVSRNVTLGIRLFITIMCVAYIILQVIKTLICLPVRAYWDLSVHGSCMDQSKVFVTDSSLAIVTDSGILLLSCLLAFALRLPLWHRIKVVLMLSAGGAAVAVASFKTYLLVTYMDSLDYSYDFAEPLFFSYLEITIGQVCASLPLTKLLVEKCTRARRRGEDQSSSNRLLGSWASWTGKPRSSRSRRDTKCTVSSPRSVDGDLSLDPTSQDITSGINEWGENFVSIEFHQHEEYHPISMDGLHHAEQGASHALGSAMDNIRTPTEILVPDRIWDGVTRDQIDTGFIPHASIR